MVRALSFLIRYFSNYYTLLRSDLAARAAPLDPRLLCELFLSFTKLYENECKKSLRSTQCKRKRKDTTTLQVIFLNYWTLEPSILLNREMLSSMDKNNFWKQPLKANLYLRLSLRRRSVPDNYIFLKTKKKRILHSPVSYTHPDAADE